MDTHHNRSFSAMVLAALGIVYGDIGTSPLYTLRESFLAAEMAVNEVNILGFVSLIFWALILVVTTKYVLAILYADNKGEGGVIVLMQQAMQHLRGKPQWMVMMMGLIGTSLFFGDSMITPAVSVLSAAEGLTVISPSLTDWVLPIAIAVLFGLFIIQRHGTQRIGSLFGPVMLLWFSTLALVGVYQIFQHPQILQALNPYRGLYFVTHHGWGGFVSLGAVVLAVTGAEALYADMGHFGRKPIQMAWLSMVLPALSLNYIGQGALLMGSPEAIQNPFFLSVPKWGLIPLIILATFATIIASQAVISGAYSLTRQAIQLGFAPRMQVNHTSETEIGQIYIPSINWMLLCAVLLVVLGFRSSSNLAAAYGIAVTGTMTMTTIMFGIVLVKNWHWPKVGVFALLAAFLVVDLTFFSSNLLKLVSGGWFPMMIGCLLVFILSTWRRGRLLLSQQQADSGLELDAFLDNLMEYPPQAVAGSAVYMVSNPFTVPKALLHNLKHNKVLHERNILLTVQTQDVPYVPDGDRIAIKQLNARFVRIIANYGFQESPRVRQIIALAKTQGINLELMDTSFFLSRDSIRVSEKTPQGHMVRVRTRFFKWLYRNSTPPTDFYRIPSNRVVEMGSQVNL